MKEQFGKYVEIRPLAYDGAPDAHDVFLKVDEREFRIKPCETLAEAEWNKDMLCQALAKIVAKERSRSDA